jgi:fibronectin type 3 domain-containing protein
MRKLVSSMNSRHLPPRRSAAVASFAGFALLLSCMSAARAAVPWPPSALSSNPVSASEVDVAWWDNSSDETAFEVWRQSADSAYSRVAVLGPNVTSWHDTMVTAETEYSYKIRATNSDGASAWVGPVIATPTTQMPPWPGAFAARPISSSEVDLTWRDASWNETAFNLWRAAGNGNFSLLAVLPPNTTSYQDRSVTAETTYTYLIDANNNIGGYGSVGPVFATPTAQLPAPPSGLSAKPVSGSDVAVTWRDNSYNETAFAVWRAVGSGDFSQIAALAANTTSYEDTSVTAETTYRYQVRASNNVGASSWAGPVLAIPTTRPLAAPSGLRASVISSTQIQLNWTDNSTNETAFEIWRKPAGGSYSFLSYMPANSSSFLDGSVGAGGTYTYAIRAINATLVSPFSPEVAVSASGPAAIAAPSGLGATTLSASQIKLAWTDNSTNETAFEIWRKPAGGSYAFISYMPVNATSFTDAGVSPGVTYNYTIRAINATMVSAFTPEITVTAGALNAIAMPTGLAATVISSTQIQLNWTDNSSNETAFEIWRKPAGGSYAFLSYMPANSSSFLDTSVGAGGTYTYVIRATNATLVSPFTPEVTVTAGP